MASSALGSQSIALLQLPSGTLIDFAGTIEPSGWLLCDGRAVSRTTYASLFASISTAFGSGDGSTTFNLPDFRGRFARYNDNMGTAQGAASRDTGRAHGSAQTQATAKNGLALTGSNNADVRVKAPYGNQVVMPFGTSGSGFQLNSGTNGNVTGAALEVNTTIGLGNGDSETRPINLACNKLIKI